MRTLALLPLLFAVFASIAPPAFARGRARAHVRKALNPVGAYGDQGEWDASWSNGFFQCWDKYAEQPKGPQGGPFETMIRGGLKDLGEKLPWCSAPGALDHTYQIKLFALGNLKALCIHEAYGCNPAAVNPNGTTETAIGLYQIGVVDAARKYKCKDLSGNLLATAADLKDPEKNLCCAVQIMNRRAELALEKKKAKPSFTNGASGIMSAFWEPYRTKWKKEDIRKRVNADCRSLASGGYSGAVDSNLTSDEFAKGRSGNINNGGRGSDNGHVQDGTR